MKTALKKVVRLGTMATMGNNGTVAANVFCKVEWDGKRFSISGVIGPKRNGDALGGCGQIDTSIREALGKYFSAQAPWTKESVIKFLDIWDRWHLNDMRAGCEHQRAEKWDEQPIDPSKPTNVYGKHFPGQQQDSWNMLVWVTRREHPKGLLSYPCSVCNYKYGSKWLLEEVPAEVITYIESLPDTDVTPAWI